MTAATKIKTIIFFVVIFCCSIIFQTCGTNRMTQVAGVNNNVCKKLSGEIVVYAIFVDTKYTSPWTKYDIYSTIDSIKRATNWLENKAQKNGVSLKIKLDYHQNNRAIPIVKNLPEKSLHKTLITLPISYGIKRTDRWANKLASEAGKSFPADTSSIIRTKIKITDRERLIAKLRDIHKTDNVALVYLINNYYINDLSAAIHINSQTDNTEYAIVSYKSPSVIAHELLHLFGAIDLYLGPWDSNRKVRRKKVWAMKEFPNEIMAFAYRNIDSLEISDLTKYLIGWQNSLNEDLSNKIFGRHTELIRY